MFELKIFMYNKKLKWKSDFEKSVIIENFLNRGWIKSQEKEDDSTDWNVYWATVWNQIINHFPNHYELTRKDYMVKNLKRFKREQDKETYEQQGWNFDFLPTTYIFPGEYSLFVEEFHKCPNQTWIVKPAARSQGQGIFLLRKIQQLKKISGTTVTSNMTQLNLVSKENYVVSKYIDNPLLIGGKKFDLRMYECLIQSEQPEQLAEDNAWYCKVCKEHVQAYKSMQIYKASDILIFTLKRFKASSGFFKQKLETFVEFPVKGLDLTEFILNKNRPLDYEWELKQQQKIEEELPEQNENDKNDEKLLYDLFAVSNHFGGMGGGHYTAFGKNHLNGNWYSFDDAQVSEVDEDQIVTKSAYVLFYKRRSKQQNTQDFKTQD
ncbi:unnamed protein product [Paramecium primaurelia]|uniref:USP domain-containing protein n=1 Tax=Paramecium primaurelia TaxID=5886 RepID=A0A8S1NVU3_PARPR|nr:unnamed protein product [Paramecium primaurelia]